MDAKPLCAALPDLVQNLIDAFARLPGIGPKTASRLAFYLLKAPDESSLQLAEALNSSRVSNAALPDML